LIRFLVAIKDFGWLSIRAVGRGVGGLWGSTWWRLKGSRAEAPCMIRFTGLLVSPSS
jgi:hypothetical protein